MSARAYTFPLHPSSMILLEHQTEHVTLHSRPSSIYHLCQGTIQSPCQGHKPHMTYDPWPPDLLTSHAGWRPCCSTALASGPLHSLLPLPGAVFTKCPRRDPFLPSDRRGGNTCPERPSWGRLSSPCPWRRGVLFEAATSAWLVFPLPAVETALESRFPVAPVVPWRPVTCA